VHLALLKNGIDPYIGVLHTDRYGGAPVMTFDFIEPYRPWADRVAMSLIAELVKDDQHFMPDEEGHGLWLSRSGKGTVIDAMLKFMGATDLYHGKQTKRSVQIDLDARSFAAELMR
jgi:CRISPR-associated protein Cas1